MRRIAASFVVTDALARIASSSLLALLASPGVAAAMVIRIGSGMSECPPWRFDSP